MCLIPFVLCKNTDIEKIIEFSKFYVDDLIGLF